MAIELMEQIGMAEGSVLTMEVDSGEWRLGAIDNDSGPERFTPERIAEFLLNNSCGEADYRENLTEVVRIPNRSFVH